MLQAKSVNRASGGPHPAHTGGALATGDPSKAGDSALGCNPATPNPYGRAPDRLRIHTQEGCATALSAFGLGSFLRRDYWVSVIFITLFIVVLTESLGPATLELTVERFGDTAAGRLLAMLAAFLFWPVWERVRFRPILARALRANAAYMRIVGDRLASGKCYDAEVVRAKRAAESASGAVFSSLQRMSGDPKNFRNLMSELAAVANGNQRVTRALNLIILEAHPDAPIPEASDLATHRASALE